MRKNIVAGNWKMNLLAHEAVELFNEIQHFTLSETPSCRVLVFPGTIYLPALQSNSTIIEIGGQNCHFESHGAFTGEVSLSQLRSIGLSKILIGHSERRSIFHETDQETNKKVLAALNAGFEAFICIGESLSERTSQKHFEIVSEQLNIALSEVSESDMKNIVIAYEPVWAIGTGETASPEQAQEMHQHIRQMLTELYSEEIAQNTSILYGGSVKPSNAKEIFGKEDVDGGLIGGASLNAGDFIEIISSF